MLGIKSIGMIQDFIFSSQRILKKNTFSWVIPMHKMKMKLEKTKKIRNTGYDDYDDFVVLRYL